MENVLDKRIEEAKNGRLYWLALQEKYKLDTTSYILLIPDEEDILHLKKRFMQYISKKNGSMGVVLADSSMLSKVTWNEKNLAAETCTRHEAENLMRFYCMYQFTSNLLIASLEKPDGRKGGKLIGKNGLNREEILDMVVFGIGNGQEVEEIENGF